MLIGGIEAGGTKFICAIYDVKRSCIKCKIQIKTTNPQETLQEIFDWFDWVEREEGKMDSIGLGLFGPLDLDPLSVNFGCIKTTPKIGWENINIVKILYEKFQIPIGFNTDVNSAVIGEGSLDFFSSYDRLLYITIGTGIGVGFLNKGQTLFNDAHLECGHMILPKLHNDKFHSICPYHIDCWEGLCSGPAITKRMNKSASHISGSDPVWEKIIEYTAIAIHNLTLSFAPQKIILGGSARNMGTGSEKNFFSLLNAKFKPYSNQYSGNYFDQDFIAPPLWGDNSGIYGAFVMGKAVFDAQSDCSVITKIGKIQ